MDDMTQMMRSATETMLKTVSDYKKDLVSFNNKMEEKIGEVEKNLADIKRNWNDANFDAFNKIVKEKIKVLKEQVETSRRLSEIIADTEKDFANALSELN